MVEDGREEERRKRRREPEGGEKEEGVRRGKGNWRKTRKVIDRDDSDRDRKR